MSNDLISVILPVYNGASYLSESINSILNQTYNNFELIIINDGSIDNSEAIINSFSDSRIVYIKNTNQGLAASLNQGIKLAKGKYIARQDQDDISLPLRFEKQVDFFNKNPDVVLLGTRAIIFTNDNQLYGKHNHSTITSQLHFDLMFDNPFVHSSIMFLKNVTEYVGLYNEDKSLFEDYEFWSRIANYGKICNLKDELVKYRHHDLGMSKANDFKKNNSLLIQNQKNISALLKNEFTNVTYDLIHIMHGEYGLYKKSSINLIKKELRKIAEQLKLKYVNEHASIETRYNQYVKIIKWKFNKRKRLIYSTNKLMQFYLRVLSRMQGLIANIQND